jgi:hypothetical protein
LREHLPARLKKGEVEMGAMKRRLRNGVGSVGVPMLALCSVLTLAFAQTSAAQEVKTEPVSPVVGGYKQVKPLLPGGPAPRTKDGHVDLTGRWYPNAAGIMLDLPYPELDPAAYRQFDPNVTPEEKASFKPGIDAKYRRPAPFGDCDQAGTPSTTADQTTRHFPMELIQSPDRLVMLYEYPLDVRMIYMNGRVHPKDPDPTFNGDSAAHWEGDTLVVDVIALDDRLRINGGTGGWYPSDQEHVVERFTRPSKNYLIYQVTIDDPIVLAKPWTSAPRTWSLARPGDEWGEFFCTHNEEPEEIKKMNEAEEKAK